MHTDAVSLCRVPDTRTQHHLCTCTGIPCRDLWHICVCAECLKMALGKSWGEGLGVKHYWGEVSLYVNSFLSGIALISMCYKCATNEKNDRKRVNHFRLQQQKIHMVLCAIWWPHMVISIKNQLKKTFDSTGNSRIQFFCCCFLPHRTEEMYMHFYWANCYSKFFIKTPYCVFQSQLELLSSLNFFLFCTLAGTENEPVYCLRWICVARVMGDRSA